MKSQPEVDALCQKNFIPAKNGNNYRRRNFWIYRIAAINALQSPFILFWRQHRPAFSAISVLLIPIHQLHGNNRRPCNFLFLYRPEEIYFLVNKAWVIGDHALVCQKTMDTI